MDTEKQKSSPGGTVPGEKVPPVLMAEDVAALEELCGDVSGYFYKMLDYLDQRVRDGVRQGEFTEEQARGDLDLALWYAYACNNIDDYDYYYKAAQWMPASEPAAEAAGSGIWYYRYACALMYCGRLEEARHYAETGVSLDPEYPWGWLETGKLRAHFGDRDGALEAVRRGLVEVLQRDYHVNIAGPSTMAALLNSLQMSFRTIAIQKRSGEVWSVLGAVKTEFDKFEACLTQTQTRLDQASRELDKLVGTRTRAIRRKLKSVTELSEAESETVLALGEDAAEPEE